MRGLLRRTRIFNRRRRIKLSVCLLYVQALAPEWPLLLVWPFVKVSVTSAIARFSYQKSSTSSF